MTLNGCITQKYFLGLSNKNFKLKNNENWEYDSLIAFVRLIVMLIIIILLICRDIMKDPIMAIFAYQLDFCN